mgnify:CR=1 FL=1
MQVEITKRGKELREDALKFQKSVIAKESELIAIIQPIEQDLTNKEESVELEKERLRRMEKLPMRHAALKAYGQVLTDEELLLFDDLQFESILNSAKAEFLHQKEMALKEEAERIDEEKRRMEEEKQATIRAAERAEAATKAKIEAEKREKQREAELVAARAEAAANARIEAEEEARRKEEAQKEAEALALKEAKKEQKRVEKLAEYKNFLESHGYTEVTKSLFHVERTGNTVTLYKTVGQFLIE